MRKAYIEIEFDSEEDLEIIFKSVEPEVKKKIPRTVVGMRKAGNKMILEISSDDTSSLRAACNSFLRWIETARSVREGFAED
ncbi:MAG TPA: hypothetical protein ENG60_03035 [Thermoplasmatales archaeon]|nr:hypothetical protein [Thermoplasmatales archaeon]HEX17370.1 hypothetical protein [Thermoplasmatales archaeon]